METPKESNTSKASNEDALESIKIDPCTGKEYKGIKLVDCDCACHKKGSEMVHFQACCYNGKMEVLNFI